MNRTREYDLDWLRAIGMLSVFLYHCTMFLNLWGWHVKNPTLSPGIGAFSNILIQWIMPLFFVISGVATYHALQRRTSGEFLRERALRLGVPLLLGIFLLSPPQIYIERLTNGQFQGSFWAFLPHYFDGFYAFGGNFAWMGLHAWYLLVLLLYSTLTLPFFKRLAGRRTDRTEAALQSPVWLLVAPIPPILFEIFLDRQSIGTQAMGGWNILTYLFLFIYGFCLFSSPGFRAGLRRVGPYVVAIAVITSLLMTYAYFVQPHVSMAVGAIVRVLMSWSWVASLLYLGGRYLNVNHPRLPALGDLVMPFYVIHQPVIVILAFFLRPLDWAPILKLLVLAPAAFTVIMLLYRFVVQPFKPVRFLMGMK